MTVFHEFFSGSHQRKKTHTLTSTQEKKKTCRSMHTTWKGSMAQPPISLGLSWPRKLFATFWELHLLWFFPDPTHRDRCDVNVNLDHWLKDRGLRKANILNPQMCRWKKSQGQPPCGRTKPVVNNGDFNYYLPTSTGELIPNFWLPSTVCVDVFPFPSVAIFRFQPFLVATCPSD